MSVTKLNAQDFDKEVLNSSGTVMVDFFADWCGPCKMLSPVVDQIAAEKPECKFFKLNVDDAPTIAAKYGVMSIPTLIVFKDGKVANQSVGVQSKQNILKMIEG